MQIQCNIISQDENTVTYLLLDSHSKEQYTMEKADIEKIYPHTEESVTPSKKEVESPKIEENPHDIIVLNDGTKLDVILVEVADKQVKYKKANNTEGPLFVKEIANISSIIFANGEREDFTQEAIKVAEESSKSTTINSTPELSTQSSANRAAQQYQTDNSEKGFTYMSEDGKIIMTYDFSDKVVYLKVDEPLIYHSRGMRNIAIVPCHIDKKDLFLVLDMGNKVEGVAFLSGIMSFNLNWDFHRYFKKKMPKTFVIDVPYETKQVSYIMKLAY